MSAVESTLVVPAAQSAMTSVETGYKVHAVSNNSITSGCDLPWGRVRGREFFSSFKVGNYYFFEEYHKSCLLKNVFITEIGVQGENVLLP